MSRAKQFLKYFEAKFKPPRKGETLTIKKNNFRFKGKKVKVISTDDPKTGDLNDILIKVKIGSEEVEVGIGELEEYKDLIKKGK